MRISFRIISICLFIFSSCKVIRIEPKYLKFIYSKKNAESKLVIVEGVKGGRPGATIAPPLVIYRDDGSYSDEVGRMFIP